MSAPSTPRIVGYDLARALAIIGMVIVNFKTVMHSKEAIAGAAWQWFNLIDGRASALFVMLAGAGLSLLSRQSRLAADQPALIRQRHQLLRRAASLFVIGLCYLPVWPADILHYYGIYIALGALTLGWRSRDLLLLAAALIAGFGLLFLQIRYDTAWNWQTLDYTDLWTLPGFLRHLFYNGFHPVLPWAAFLLAGMVLGRLDLRQPSIRRRLLAVGIAGLVSGQLLGWVLVQHTAGLWADNQPMPPLPRYMLEAGSTACILISLCIGLGERFRQSWLLQPLIHTGQLALTLYVAHVVIGMGVLEALGLLSRQPLSVAVSSALLFCLCAIVFAHAWRRRFALGPLEWLLRRASGS